MRISLVNKGAALGDHLGYRLLQLGSFLDELLDLLVQLIEVTSIKAELDDVDQDSAGAVGVAT